MKQTRKNFTISEECVQALWSAICELPEPQANSAAKNLGCKINANLLVDRAAHRETNTNNEAENAFRPSPWMIMIAIKQIVITETNSGARPTKGNLVSPGAYDSELRAVAGKKRQAWNIKRRMKTQLVNYGCAKVRADGEKKDRNDTDATRFAKELRDNQFRLQDIVCAFLNEWRGDWGVRPLTAKRVFADPSVKGPGAIEALRKIIVPPEVQDARSVYQFRYSLDATGWFDDQERANGRTFRFALEPKSASPANDPDPRHTELDKIAEAIFDFRSDYRIINPFGAGRWGGLSALAKHLTKHRPGASNKGRDEDATLRERYNCPWPILYVPLRVRSVDELKDTYPFIVHKVYEFYVNYAKKIQELNCTEDKAALKPQTVTRLKSDQTVEIEMPLLSAPRNDNEIADMVDRIRKLASCYPAIIVFDSFHKPLPSGQAKMGTYDASLLTLKRAIVDDQILSLIERICMPLTPTLDPASGENHMLSSFDSSKLNQNKFVILSDRPLYHRSRPNSPSGDSHPALRALPGISLPLSPPRSSSREELVGQFDLQCPGEIHQIQRLQAQSPDKTSKEEKKQQLEHLAEQQQKHVRAVADMTKDPRISEDADSECVLGILSTIYRVSKLARIQATTGPLTSENSLNWLITKALLPVLKKKSDGLWLLFFKILTLAPGGLRPKTLARIYEHYYEITKERRLSREEINREILEMLEKCHGIIGLYRSDYLEALLKDGDERVQRRVPMAFMDRRKRGPEIATERTIEFEFPELQTALLATFTSKEKPLLQFLHHLLAEEAFAQFRITARYSDLRRDATLRRHGRLLECLYHGAASLGDHTLVPHPEKYRGKKGSLPDAPQKRWAVLFGFMFERILDHSPDFRLARTFAADHLKADILKLLSAPQLAFGQELPYELPRVKVTEVGAPKLDAFNVALIQASNSIGEQIPLASRYEFTGPEEGVPEDRPAKLASGEGLDFKLEKRLLDADINGPNTSGDRAHLAGIKDELVRPVLETIPGFENVEKLLKPIEKDIRERVGTNNYREVLAENLISENKLSKLFKKTDPRTLKSACDFLNRFAELTALDAELELGETLNRRRQQSIVPPVIRLDGTGTPSTENNSFIAIIAGFSKAMAAYHLSDTIRRRLFYTNSKGRIDRMGGHHGRSLIRTLLKLERLSEWACDSSELENRPGWFWHQAHRIADEMIAHLSEFPRERAGLLVLEATMARHSSLDDSSNFVDSLREALECLQSAEIDILRLGMHSTLRLRFLLERAKILMAVAKRTLKKTDQIALPNVENVARTVAIDLQAMKGMLDHRQHPIWSGILAHQMHKFCLLVAKMKPDAESDLVAMQNLFFSYLSGRSGESWGNHVGTILDRTNQEGDND